MNQNGPQWRTEHVHSIKVLSDLIMMNPCAQGPARSPFGPPIELFGGLDCPVLLSALAQSAGFEGNSPEREVVP
jgi:hypothetical protein